MQISERCPTSGQRIKSFNDGCCERTSNPTELAQCAEIMTNTVCSAIMESCMNHNVPLNSRVMYHDCMGRDWDCIIGLTVEN